MTRDEKHNIQFFVIHRKKPSVGKAAAAFKKTFRRQKLFPFSIRPHQYASNEVWQNWRTHHSTEKEHRKNNPFFMDFHVFPSSFVSYPKRVIRIDGFSKVCAPKLMLLWFNAIDPGNMWPEFKNIPSVHFIFRDRFVP